MAEPEATTGQQWALSWRADPAARAIERWSIVCRTGDLHHVDGQSWPSAEATEAAKQVLEHLIPKAGAWHCEPHVVVLR